MKSILLAVTLMLAGLAMAAGAAAADPVVAPLPSSAALGEPSSAAPTMPVFKELGDAGPAGTGVAPSPASMEPSSPASGVPSDTGTSGTADPLPPVEGNPWDGALAAAKQGLWLVAICSVIVALVAFAKRKQGWFVKALPWFGTPRGGAVLVFFLGFIGEVAARYASNSSGGPPPGFVAVLLAAASSGGRTLLKSLFTPAPPAGGG